MEKRKLETTVGFFILLGVIIFFIIIFFVSGLYLFRDGYHLNVEYDYCAGLSKGSVIRMAGVKIGEVNKITLKYDPVTDRPKAFVDIWVEKGVKIKEDYLAYIIGTFALNERLIEIIPVETSSADYVNEGGILKGVSPVPMELIVEGATDLLNKIGKVSDYIYSIVGDEQLQEDLRSTIVDMSALLKYARAIIADKDSEINGFIENASGSLNRLESILTSIDEGQGTLGKLINDETLYIQIKDLINNIDKETNSLIKEIKKRPWRLFKRDKKKK